MTDIVEQVENLEADTKEKEIEKNDSDLDPQAMTEIIKDFEKVVLQFKNNTIIDNVTRVVEERFSYFNEKLELSKFHTLRLLDSHYNSIGKNQLVVSNDEKLKLKKKKVKKVKNNDPNISNLQIFDESKANQKIQKREEVKVEKVELKDEKNELKELKEDNIDNNDVADNNNESELVLKRLDEEYTTLDNSVKEIEGKMNLVSFLMESINKKSLQELFTFDNKDRIIFYKLNNQSNNNDEQLLNYSWSEPLFKEIIKEQVKELIKDEEKNTEVEKEKNRITFNSSKCNVYNCLNKEFTEKEKSIMIEIEYTNNNIEGAVDTNNSLNTNDNSSIVRSSNYYNENVICIGLVNEHFDLAKNCICSNPTDMIYLNSKGKIYYNKHEKIFPELEFGYKNSAKIVIGLILKDKKIIFNVDNNKIIGGPYSLIRGTKFRLVVCSCGVVEKASFNINYSKYLKTC